MTITNMNNQTTIEGRLGADVIVRQTKNSKSVTNLSVAINQNYRNDDGDLVEMPPVWVAVTVWGKLAELCEQHTGKGMLVRVQGALAMTTGQTKVETGSGKSKQTQTVEYPKLCVNASEVRFIERKPKPEADNAQAAASHVAEPDF
jgi:single stranded DNA-binding protein